MVEADPLSCRKHAPVKPVRGLGGYVKERLALGPLRILPLRGLGEGGGCFVSLTSYKQHTPKNFFCKLFFDVFSLFLVQWSCSVLFA